MVADMVVSGRSYGVGSSGSIRGDDEMGDGCMVYGWFMNDGRRLKSVGGMPAGVRVGMFPRR